MKIELSCNYKTLQFLWCLMFIFTLQSFENGLMTLCLVDYPVKKGEVCLRIPGLWLVEAGSPALWLVRMFAAPVPLCLSLCTFSSKYQGQTFLFSQWILCRVDDILPPFLLLDLTSVHLSSTLSGSRSPFFAKKFAMKNLTCKYPLICNTVADSLICPPVYCKFLTIWKWKSLSKQLFSLVLSIYTRSELLDRIFIDHCKYSC